MCISRGCTLILPAWPFGPSAACSPPQNSMRSQATHGGFPPALRCFRDVCRNTTTLQNALNCFASLPTRSSEFIFDNRWNVWNSSGIYFKHTYAERILCNYLYPQSHALHFWYSFSLPQRRIQTCNTSHSHEGAVCDLKTVGNDAVGAMCTLNKTKWKFKVKWMLSSIKAILTAQISGILYQTSMLRVNVITSL